MTTTQQPRAAHAPAARIGIAARQLTGYANFLRWSANFPKEELTRHPRHARVMLLSPMQSGRFAFCVEGDTVYLGVQAFEAVWLANMPFSGAYLSDRLYLAVDGVACIDSKLQALSLGIFVDDERKRARMAAASWLQPVAMQVANGRVSALGGVLGPRIAITARDIGGALAQRASATLAQQDIARFF